MLSTATPVMQRILTSSDWTVVAFLLQVPIKQYPGGADPPKWFTSLQREECPSPKCSVQIPEENEEKEEVKIKQSEDTAPEVLCLKSPPPSKKKPHLEALKSADDASSEGPLSMCSKKDSKSACNKSNQSCSKVKSESKPPKNVAKGARKPDVTRPKHSLVDARHQNKTEKDSVVPPKHTPRVPAGQYRKNDRSKEPKRPVVSQGNHHQIRKRQGDHHTKPQQKRSVQKGQVQDITATTTATTTAITTTSTTTTATNVTTNTTANTRSALLSTARSTAAKGAARLQDASKRRIRDDTMNKVDNSAISSETQKSSARDVDVKAKQATSNESGNSNNKIESNNDDAAILHSVSVDLYAEKSFNSVSMPKLKSTNVCEKRHLHSKTKQKRNLPAPSSSTTEYSSIVSMQPLPHMHSSGCNTVGKSYSDTIPSELKKKKQEADTGTTNTTTTSTAANSTNCSPNQSSIEGYLLNEQSPVSSGVCSPRGQPGHPLTHDDMAYITDVASEVASEVMSEGTATTAPHTSCERFSESTVNTEGDGQQKV